MNEWTNIEPNHHKGQKGFNAKDIKRDKIVALRLTEDQLKLIEDYCESNQESKADTIRKAIVYFLTSKGYNVNVDKAKVSEQQTNIFTETK